MTKWPTKKLGDPEVAAIIMGQSPPGSTYNTSGDGLPFYQGKKDFGSLYPTPSVWCSEPSKIAEADDILISVRAPVGPVNLCREKSAIGRGLAILRPNRENLNHRFLFLYLKSHESHWKIPGGAVFGAITKKNLENLEIPLPPLAEQERIVEKIEKLFAKIDEASRLRAQSLAASAALLPSAFHQVFSRAEKENWPTKKLGEICEFQNGLWTGKRPPFRKITVLRNTNFRNDGYLDLSNVAEIEVEEKQLASRILQRGDLILERSGGGPTQPVGRVIYFDVDGDFSFSNFTTRIRIIDRSEIDSIYLWRYLNYLYISGTTENLQKQTTGIRNLNFTEYKQLKIPLPPIAEQKKIVAYLDALSTKVRELQNLQSQTATDFSALRQSILHYALNGRI